MCDICEEFLNYFDTDEGLLYCLHHIFKGVFQEWRRRERKEEGRDGERWRETDRGLPCSMLYYLIHQDKRVNVIHVATQSNDQNKAAYTSLIFNFVQTYPKLIIHTNCFQKNYLVYLFDG